MQPPIFKLCAANPAVTALLGTNPVRLFPWGEAPQGVAHPYAVWQVIGGTPENYLAERPDVDGFYLQVDVYAKTGAGANNVAEALRHAIELDAYITRWGGQDKDPETSAYHIGFDVDWLVPR